MPDEGPWMSPQQVAQFQPPMPEKNDVLTDFEREVLGRHARLEIPLSHSRDLRRFADVLRGVANQLDLLSREAVLPEAVILGRVKREIVGLANLKMKGPTKARSA